MSSHERDSPVDPARGSEFSSGVPVDLPSAEPMSWELGRRVLEGDASRLMTAEHARSGRSVTAFDVAEHTCVVRVRTPAGRERFYGTRKTDLRRGVDGLRRREDWTLREWFD